MSDNWVVQNLENALNTWNEKLAEIWQLITQSLQQFKGGAIWSVIVNIHGALQVIGIALAADVCIERCIYADTEERRKIHQYLHAAFLS